ncbi:DUF4291 domain-containing protein [Deinococcus sp. KNUC1210]|uniref:DUF4291 family protein n=1 Tax=Deinococcus sp. KNUC1210 TaxID=2917691 RepID=UPI001EF0EA63|nr:DUF4291 family protein [Deinococcus sp. KNUC1210]ULH15687.1 DUF4291 domain-containing protein [Deinococcus sp. KNUC1210]
MTPQALATDFLAAFTETTVRVYQAFPHEIATPALRHQHFVSPFSLGRMSWIKPSFFWMMYRAGWGHKELRQARILAIDLPREFFDRVIAEATLSSRLQSQLITPSDVVVQFDPDRDLHLNKLTSRALQIGLRGPVLREYALALPLQITDITSDVIQVEGLIHRGMLKEAQALVPLQQVYPTPAG